MARPAVAAFSHFGGLNLRPNCANVRHLPSRTRVRRPAALFSFIWRLVRGRSRGAPCHSIKPTCLSRLVLTAPVSVITATTQEIGRTLPASGQ